MSDSRRVAVLGVPVDCVDMDGALEIVDQMIRGDKSQTILAVNPEKVVRAQSDGRLLSTLWNAGLVLPDGIGVVYAVRRLYRRAIKRVAGSDLMPAICAVAPRRGYRIFLYGASPEVNAETVRRLRARNPGINIVGHENGFVTDDDMPGLVDRINESEANVLFIALGSPRQELWMETYLPQLRHVRVCQGVGGTFDVIAGRVKRAPLVVRRSNLEWLYRLVTEPRRASRQVALPRFTYRVLREKVGGP